MFECNITVPAEMIEPRYHHVAHYDSLRLMETARMRLLEAMGFPFDSLIERGLFIVVTHIEADYLREIRGNEVRATCQKGRRQGREMVIEQTLVNERGKRAVQAQVGMMFMSGDTRRGIEPPEEFAAALLRVTGE